MENIEALVDLLGKFGEELGNVRVLMGEIENEVKKHTVALKHELKSFKEKNNDGLSTKAALSKTEEELRDRLLLLKNDLENLEKLKRAKEESLRSENIRKTSSTSRSVKSSEEDFDESVISKKFDQHRFRASTPNEWASAPFFDKPRSGILENNNNAARMEWWESDRGNGKEDETIDWDKEYVEREELKLSLMVKEGWKKHKTSFEELEEMLRTWTGKGMKWTTSKIGKTKNGKAMMNVQFANVEDRTKIYDMRKEIAEEGHLSIGEALSYVERKERWKMLMMCELLFAKGKNVYFENRKICVDGEWWKYCIKDGWKKM